jgi:hypothetical protein
VFAPVVGVAPGECAHGVVADLGQRRLVEAVGAALAALVRGPVGV